jgi:hypothetical protein
LYTCINYGIDNIADLRFEEGNQNLFSTIKKNTHTYTHAKKLNGQFWNFTLYVFPSLIKIKPLTALNILTVASDCQYIERSSDCQYLSAVATVSILSAVRGLLATVSILSAVRGLILIRLLAYSFSIYFTKGAGQLSFVNSITVTYFYHTFCN